MMSRIHSIGGILVVLVSLSSFHIFADECVIPDGSREELEAALEVCQQQIEANERLLKQQQASRTSTEYDILLIDQEINKALVRIRTIDGIIHSLGDEISSKEMTVEGLSEQLDEQQVFLGDLLQRINEEEQRGFISLLLTNGTLSGFFGHVHEYVFLRDNVEDSVLSVNNLKARLVASVDELSGKKTEQSRVRQQQQAAANQVQYQRGQKEQVLEHQIAVEKQTQETISSYESRAAQIRNRLFELRGTGAIPFEEALQYAKETYRKTGVRPAFLLGLIKHESDLGRNVGTGSYLVDMHPTRDQPIFPYITKLLGFSDPSELKVSANPGFGWGGAMGPAQFIPSTWVCYGGLVNVNTGTCAITGSYIRGTGVLAVGSSGSDVKRLQQFLNQQGFKITSSGSGSPGNETSTYTSAVARAVSRFQERYASRILKPYGYSRGTGTVGPATRAAINRLSFYSGPWQYRSEKDVIRRVANNHRPSNPWNPRDAFFASSIYLGELGADRDECTAARRYYAGGSWRSQVALNYCRAVLSNARLFQRDIDFLEG